MLKSCDSGSLPFISNSAKFLEGASHFNRYIKDDLAEYFEKQVVKSFLDKIRVGIDVPNYPQFRDMNKMFLSMINGSNSNDIYLECDTPSVKPKRISIPEVAALKKYAHYILPPQKQVGNTRHFVQPGEETFRQSQNSCQCDC